MGTDFVKQRQGVVDRTEATACRTSSVRTASPAWQTGPVDAIRSVGGMPARSSRAKPASACARSGWVCSESGSAAAMNLTRYGRSPATDSSDTHRRDETVPADGFPSTTRPTGGHRRFARASPDRHRSPHGSAAPARGLCACVDTRAANGLPCPRQFESCGSTNRGGRVVQNKILLTEDQIPT